MSTCWAELERKQCGHDHPEVARLDRGLGDEVLARGAHAGDVAAEQRTTIADPVASDGETMVAYSDGGAAGIGALGAARWPRRRGQADVVVPEYRGPGVTKRFSPDFP
jgi:hypothetical protein